MNTVSLYNTSYARFVRKAAPDWGVIRFHATPEDMRWGEADDAAAIEGDLRDAHALAAKHVLRVVATYNKGVASLGIPMWDDLAIKPIKADMRPHLAFAGAPDANAYTNPRVHCGRCDGSGITAFKHVEAGVCFRCEGSGDEANPYPRVRAPRAPETFPSELDDMPVRYFQAAV